MFHDLIMLHVTCYFSMCSVFLLHAASFVDARRGLRASDCMARLNELPVHVSGRGYGNGRIERDSCDCATWPRLGATHGLQLSAGKPSALHCSPLFSRLHAVVKGIVHSMVCLVGWKAKPSQVPEAMICEARTAGE